MQLRILDIMEDTMVDGPGFRTAVYAAGCRHRCPGCHNPQSWDFRGGRACTIEEVMDIIVADPFADVTFTGGDPFYQAEAFAGLARAIHARTDKTIWCYTGFLYEELLQKPAMRPLLEQVDVLVDGPFIESLKSDECLFRGSTNQRLVDISQSLASGKVILHPQE